MKKYAMILVAISMSFVSCEKWLDLQQEGEITASQLYGKGEGYRTALNGLYQAMGRPVELDVTLYREALSKEKR